MTFSIAIALWQVEFPVDIPAAAVQALTVGFDSPTLRVLAGLQGADRSELAPLVDRTVRELGLQLPTRPQAVLEIARDIARRILSGEVAADEGAHKIWHLSLEADVDHLLDPFIYAASELDDVCMRPASPERDRLIAVYEGGILSAARELVGAL